MEVRGTHTLAERLRAARVAVGMTQADLARRAGLSESGIAALERGARRPSPRARAAIERVLVAAAVDAIEVLHRIAVTGLGDGDGR